MSISIRAIGWSIAFFSYIFVWFWYEGDTALVKVSWEVFSIFWKTFLFMKDLC